MKRKNMLTEAEYDVMMELWEFPKGMKQSELLMKMNEKGKNWARQTLNTVITKLIEKGMIDREKRFVCAAISKEDYCNNQVLEMVKEWYNGRLSNLFLTFTKEKRLTQEDVRELEEILKTYEAE